MTTKTSDKAVLAEIGNIPITASEIARKVGIHRSNVAPRLIRLEKAGLIKSINSRWVRTDSNKSATIPGARMTPAQIAFCEKLLSIDGDYEIDDSHIEHIMPCDIEEILTNLSVIAPDNEFIEYACELAMYDAECGVDDDEKERVDDLLGELRELITGEKQTVPGTRLTPEQIKFCEKLLINSNWTIDCNETTDSTRIMSDILDNLAEMYPENEQLELIGTLALNVYCYDDESYDIDTVLRQLREFITGEENPIIPGSRLTPKQIEFCEKLIYGENYSQEFGEPKDDAGVFYDIFANMHNIYPENNFLGLISELAFANFDKSAIDIDNLLASIRKEITGKPTPTNTIPKTRLTPAQIEFAEKLFTTEECISLTRDMECNNINEVLVGITQNLKKMYPDNEYVEIIADLTFDGNKGLDTDDPDVIAYVDELLVKLRKRIIYESVPTIPETSLSPKKGKKPK
jgi:DNA-binding Lrp family transcriptional regulator